MDPVGGALLPRQAQTATQAQKCAKTPMRISALGALKESACSSKRLRGFDQIFVCG
jgi:hypothetical protein